MGVEIIVLIVVLGVVSITAGITSVCSILRTKNTSTSDATAASNDTTSVIIKNKAITIKNKDGSTYMLKLQEIELRNMDESTQRKFLDKETSSTETGRENKASEALASGGVGALASIASPAQTAHVLINRAADVVDTLASNKKTPTAHRMEPIEEELEEKQMDPVREEHEYKHGGEEEETQFITHQKPELASPAFIDDSAGSDLDPEVRIDVAEESDEEALLAPDLMQESEQEAINPVVIGENNNYDNMGEDFAG